MTYLNNHFVRGLAGVAIVSALLVSPSNAGRKGGGGKSARSGGNANRNFGQRNRSLGNNMRRHVSSRGKSTTRHRAVGASNQRQSLTKRQASHGNFKHKMTNNKNRSSNARKTPKKRDFGTSVKRHAKNYGRDFARGHATHGGKKGQKFHDAWRRKAKNHGQNYHHRDRYRHKVNFIRRNSWCHQRPRVCHWWYDRCDAIRYYRPEHCINYDWTYITCDSNWRGHVIEDARWYLGLKATLLPGTGLGIESVAAGSPAEAAGLQPGMIITYANDVQMIDENSMPTVLAASGGVLKLVIVASQDAEPQSVSLVLQRVASQSF